MERPGPVVVVGSANIDSTFSMERLPSPGETVAGASLTEATGGVGANQAVAASRSGAAVELVAAVGAGEGGTALLASLRREGVGVEFCRRLDGTATGRAAIWVDRSGENRIVVASGANAELNAATVEMALAEIEVAKVILCQLETPPEAASAALRWAMDNGATGILNASPVMDRAELPTDAAIVVVNQIEAAHIARQAGVSTHDPVQHAGTIREVLNAPTVVVTLGAEGAIACCHGEISRTSSHQVDAVDTTGAGDAFAGSLAARLALGEALESALVFACAAGALATTQVGACSAAPAADAVEAFMQTASRTQHVSRVVPDEPR